jgi:NhaA family Na+:H+ antiporter
MAVGALLWLCIFNSGVHATIAGILVGLFVPLRSHYEHIFPLKTLEKHLHPWVSFGILPIFAFFNAGIAMIDLSLSSMAHPVAAGIILGLVVGKPLGVMLMSFITIQLKICHLPHKTTWTQFYGMSMLTGIGFTMSLFIGSLSFSDMEYQNIMRLGVISGSLLAGLGGYGVLVYSTSAHLKENIHSSHEIDEVS